MTTVAPKTTKPPGARAQFDGFFKGASFAPLMALFDEVARDVKQVRPRAADPRACVCVRACVRVCACVCVRVCV